MKPKDKLNLKIIYGDWLKDVDTFGKQDPYLQFKIGSETFKTEVKDGGGKHVDFNQTFELTGIFDAVNAGEELVI